MTIFERAIELKDKASVMHYEANRLPQGEAAALHKRADVIWNEANDLELIGLIDRVGLPPQSNRCRFHEKGEQCHSQRVSPDVPACEKHEAAWRKVA